MSFPNKESLIRVHGFTKDGETGKIKEDYDNKFTIDWDDRFDEDILETVAESCFIKVAIETDKNNELYVQKFLSAYDAVLYIQEHLTEDMVLDIRGNLKYSGIEKTYVSKEITTIYLSKATTDEYRATFNQTILLDSSSIGKLDKDTNTIPLDCYVVDYVNQLKIKDKKIPVKTNLLFPVQFEYEGNLNKPETRMQILNKFFKVKKGKLTEITVEGKLVEGHSVVVIQDDDIPAEIRELIELGEYTQEEIEYKCAVGTDSREKRMLISRIQITYNTDGEQRRPVIAIEPDKYTEADKIFQSEFININENHTDNTTNSDEEYAEIYSDDELMDLLSTI